MTLKQQEGFYLKKMIPHILPFRAKELGITPKDKVEWGNLKREVKAELKERFRQSSLESIKQDLSFNRKSKTAPTSNHETPSFGYKNISERCFNREVLINTQRASDSTKSWIKQKRNERLLHSSKYQRAFMDMLDEASVKVIAKMPFVIGTHIYFADFYLIDYDLVIDIYDKRYPSDTHKLDMRAEDFKSIGLNLFRLENVRVGQMGMINSILDHFIVTI